MGISHIMFGILLIIRNKRERSDYILICWLVLLMMPFLQQLQLNTLLHRSFISRFNNQSFTLLNGPLLYLYIKELTEDGIKLRKVWPHFIIFLYFYLIFILRPAPIHPKETPQSDLNLFINFGAVNTVVFLTYTIMSLRALKNHRIRVKEMFAWQNGEINLLWISIIPLFFISIMLLVIVIEVVGSFNHVDIGKIHLSGFLIFSLYLIFFGLRQKRVYPEEKEEVKKDNTVVDDDADFQIDKLRRVMIEGELFLNPKLTIYDLSKAANISRHRISSLLNDVLKVNFYQFVNEYRLKDICERLKGDKDKNYNILELAYESGFNSKSSFNSLFKSYTGQTPSHFRKSI